MSVTLTMCKAIRILHDTLQASVNKGVGLVIRLMTGICMLFPANPAGAESVRASELVEPIGYVTDAARIIPPEIERKIAQLSEELERKTGVRVAVVTMPDLGGYEIEAFAAALLKRWIPDPQQRNRTLLLIDALTEEKFRMELGSSLDSMLSVASVRRVQDQVLVPSLESGDKGMAYFLTVTEFADVLARESNVTLYRLKGPGYLRNLPAVHTPTPIKHQGPAPSLWFLPVMMAALWIGYRETRAVTVRDVK